MRELLTEGLRISRKAVISILLLLYYYYYYYSFMIKLILLYYYCTGLKPRALTHAPEKLWEACEKPWEVFPWSFGHFCWGEACVWKEGSGSVTDHGLGKLYVRISVWALELVRDFFEGETCGKTCTEFLPMQKTGWGILSLCVKGSLPNKHSGYPFEVPKFNCAYCMDLIRTESPPGVQLTFFAMAFSCNQPSPLLPTGCARGSRQRRTTA